MAEKIFLYVGDGKIKHYTGNYSDLKTLLEDELLEASEAKVMEVKGNHVTNKKQTKSARKMSYQEQKEFEVIDEKIATIEQRISDLEQAIQLASSDYQQLQTLMGQLEQQQKELDHKMERWVYLNELADQIEQDKMR